MSHRNKWLCVTTSPQSNLRRARRKGPIGSDDDRPWTGVSVYLRLWKDKVAVHADVAAVCLTRRVVCVVVGDCRPGSLHVEFLSVCCCCSDVGVQYAGDCSWAPSPAVS